MRIITALAIFFVTGVVLYSGALCAEDQVVIEGDTIRIIGDTPTEESFGPGAEAAQAVESDYYRQERLNDEARYARRRREIAAYEERQKEYRKKREMEKRTFGKGRRRYKL